MGAIVIATFGCRDLWKFAWLAALGLSFESAACDDVACPSGTMNANGHCVMNALGSQSTDPSQVGGNAGGLAGNEATGQAGPMSQTSAQLPDASTPPSMSSGAGRGAAAGESGSGPDVSGTSGTGFSAPSASGGAAGVAAPTGEPCMIAGAIRCVSGSRSDRERCSGGLWGPSTPCSPGEVCAGLDSAQPGACLAVADVCKGRESKRTCDASGTLYTCDASGVIEAQRSCASAELCMPGIQTGMCATCAPGSFRCTGATLEVCTPDGAAFTQSKACSTAALCDAKAGSCKASTCAPGEKTCKGNDLVECNPDQTGYVTLQACGAGMCNASRGACNACTAGSMRCDGNSTVVCASDGSVENRTSCPMVCSAGRCVQCSPGETRSCGAEARGICRPGSDTCIAGVWSGCIGGVNPKTERPCDGADSDCDGDLEECPNAALSCRSADGTTKCLPAGSYLDSCYDCEVSGNTVTCTCGSQTGERPRSSTSINCAGGIWQLDGKLTC
jgi:hypothetical protein